ncbi:uncharacterized protein Z518_07314 [Rhinocladiella mackenziei CBS 650.93]|uniref:C6 transcription factor n=1 Tax=Rhinocladiella mackenziei CBS 650.93 TaxID=1442369 RepID=A0A0D2IKK8_9EURO|nr:uncharacterized protein Z518_07314 [Rhinocladiella mackenziei CBS 650.93]KIX03761.1 hypothetical protein Z518_07314 [Rhinocladiella mackenziei CBS 650.93]
MSLRTCVYAIDQLSPGSSESGATSRSSVPSPTPPPSGPFSSLLTRSRRPSPGPLTPPRALSQVGTDDAVTNFTDANLYLHFLNHTCKYAPRWHKDRIVLQIGIAKLALDSEPVSHSVLALSAACLCCDTISHGNADPETVRQILDVGLQHHTLALEQMRTMTCRPRESDIQPLLANALMLVPFALAFQHIQHWVLFAQGSQDINLLTPRDAILLLRGIRTTIVVLNSNRADRSDERRNPKSKTPWDINFSSPITDSSNFTTIPERSHTMFPVLAATFHQALSQLQCRIESALATHQADENTASAFDAYNILNDLMSSTFSNSEKIENSLEYVPHFSVAPGSLLAQAPGWLRNFVLRRPRPTSTEPLARSFLAFFSRASNTYVDLLLPLLDPRTDNVDDEPELTTAEVLALDVYAHWLVLMFLVENEAWWVGDFPVVALQGLIARYGDEFLGTSSIQEQWWPASMLEVATRLKQWK